jgi:hypothetical protein
MNLSFENLLAPAIIIIMVVVVNVGLFYSLRSKNTRRQLDLLRKAGQAAGNPWKKEDDALDELSEKVNRLRTTNRVLEQNDAEKKAE